jgi:hypothetical protein
MAQLGQHKYVLVRGDGTAQSVPRRTISPEEPATYLLAPNQEAALDALLQRGNVDYYDVMHVVDEGATPTRWFASTSRNWRELPKDEPAAAARKAVGDASSRLALFLHLEPHSTLDPELADLVHGTRKLNLDVFCMSFDAPNLYTRGHFDYILLPHGSAPSTWEALRAHYLEDVRAVPICGKRAAHWRLSHVLKRQKRAEPRRDPDTALVAAHGASERADDSTLHRSAQKHHAHAVGDSKLPDGYFDGHCGREEPGSQDEDESEEQEEAAQGEEEELAEQCRGAGVRYNSKVVSMASGHFEDVQFALDKQGRLFILDVPPRAVGAE